MNVLFEEKHTVHFFVHFLMAWTTYQPIVFYLINFPLIHYEPYQVLCNKKLLKAKKNAKKKEYHELFMFDNKNILFWNNLSPTQSRHLKWMEDHYSGCLILLHWWWVVYCCMSQLFSGGITTGASSPFSAGFMSIPSSCQLCFRHADHLCGRVSQH